MSIKWRPPLVSHLTVSSGYVGPFLTICKMGTQVHVVDVLEKNRSQKGDFEYENSIL